MSDIQGAEMQILTDWEEWSHLDTMCFLFHDVTLRYPIGTHPAGARISQIAFDLERALLHLYASETDETPETYALYLQVGPRIE